MDHKVYENNMIDFVNHHSKEKEQGRMAAEDAAREEQGYILHCHRINAAVKIVVWLAAFVCFVVGMFYLNWLNIVAPELPVAFCGVFGFVVGSRINALARVFRK